MALLQPFGVVDHRGDAGPDTVMVAIDRSILADFAVREAHGFLLGGEDLGILPQRTLIALHSRVRDRASGARTDSPA